MPTGDAIDTLQSYEPLWSQGFKKSLFNIFRDKGHRYNIPIRKTFWRREEYILKEDVQSLLQDIDDHYMVFPKEPTGFQLELLSDALLDNVPFIVKSACANCMEHPEEDCSICDGDVFFNSVIEDKDTIMNIIWMRLRRLRSRLD